MRALVLIPMLLALSAPAFAAASATATGVVTLVDLHGETVKLGQTTYRFARNFDLTQITIGEKVTITYHVAGGIDVGTAIKRAAN
jgi:hypothetical protein